MKLYIFYLCVLSSFLFSCKRETRIQEIALMDSLSQVIVVNPDDINMTEPASISEIGDSVVYIPLQTEDSILIGEIGKFLVWNNEFYIWDSLAETIFCFNSNGKFSHKIGKYGQGPDEYPHIANFTMNMKNGNLFIYSDVGKAFYEYTETGVFVQKKTSPLILSSFAVQNDYIYCYTSTLPNIEFYNQTFPSQYRYVVLDSNGPKYQYLKYDYDRKYQQMALPNNNFSFYNDTILLIEYLKPEVYTIDSLGHLKIRYRIEFTTNKYCPSFDGDLNLKRMESETEEGNLTMLYCNFFETDDYIFFNYTRGLIGMAYVRKKDYTIHNMGYFLMDDFNQNSLQASIDFVDEHYMYKIAEPGLLITKQSDCNFSKYLNNIVDEIREYDNPVIIKIKLK